MGAEDDGDDAALGDTMAASPSEDPALAPTIGGASLAGGGASESGAVTREDAGRYRRGDQIGRGAMGRVIIAFDEHLGREVAMKELLAQSKGGASSGAGVTVGVVTRFMREAPITGQLDHPNIVPVHELGRRDDGTLYYTMKRIRGRSFATVLREAKTLEDRLKLLPRFRDVCEALAYAHARGVIHRDIKPDNVMVGEFGETLVVDWGLAKVRGEDDLRGREIERRVHLMKDAEAASTIDGAAIGTPAYMSPEQARGDLESIDERSDVWGLGAMLFEILTGRAPYEGGSALSVLQKVLDEPAPRVREVLPGSPPELAAIADRALLRDASSRYPDARALAHEIVAYEEGRQVHAYSYSAFEQLRRFVGRHRAASVSVLVVALAVVSATLLSYSGYRAERDAREIAQTRRDEAIERQHAAEDELVQTRARLAHALLEHAERSLDEGDPSAAAIYAAGALLRDPANPDSPDHVDRGLPGEAARAAELRVTRARSAYLDAEDARRFVFVRRVAGASSRGGLSPDGRTLVFPAGAELAIEPATGGERRTVPVRASRVLGFLDADRVVLDGEEPMVLRLSDGAHLHALPLGAVSFARAEGRFGLGMGDGAIVTYEEESYAERARVETSVASPRLAASPEGWLVAGAGGLARWTLEAEAPAQEVAVEAPIEGVSPSPDGRRVALALRAPALSIRDAETLEATPPIATEGPVSDVAWLGRNLVVSAEGPERLVVRNVATRKRLDTLHLRADPARRVETGPRHSLIVALPSGDGLLSASVFRFERHRQRRTRPMGSSLRDLAVDVRRRRVVVATMREVAALPITTRGLGETTVLARIPPDVGIPARIAIARDGAVAVTTDRGAVLLHEPGADDPRTLAPAAGSPPCPLPVAMSADGAIVLAGDLQGRVRRYPRSAGGVLPPLEGDGSAICGLTVSSDGDAIAAASLDGEVRIWNARTGERERTFTRSELRFTDVAFALDGERLAVANDDGGVHLVRRVDAAQLAQLRLHDGWIHRVAFSRDGTHLAVAGSDGTIRYSTAEGRVRRMIRTQGGARMVAFGGEGGVLYFGDTDHLVQLSLSAHVDLSDPEALLRVAEGRAGLHLEGLDLVPR